MLIERPRDTEYDDFYAGYIGHVVETDVMAVLESQVSEVRRIASSVAGERETFRYAPEKWTIRQVVGHLIDAERAFGYRAFCVSRRDRTPLPGFDERAYMRASVYADQPIAELADEFALVRESNLILLSRLDATQLALVGVANGSPISVRALVFIMAGHVRHHQRLLRERYGVDVKG